VSYRVRRGTPQLLPERLKDFFKYSDSSQAFRSPLEWDIALSGCSPDPWQRKRYFACTTASRIADRLIWELFLPGPTDIRGLLDNPQINGNSFCFQMTVCCRISNLLYWLRECRGLQKYSFSFNWRGNLLNKDILHFNPQSTQSATTSDGQHLLRSRPSQ